MLPRADYSRSLPSLRYEFRMAMNGKYRERKSRSPEHATDLTYLFMDLTDVPEQVIRDSASAMRAMQFLGLIKGAKACLV